MKSFLTFVALFSSVIAPSFGATEEALWECAGEGYPDFTNVQISSVEGKILAAIHLVTDITRDEESVDVIELVGTESSSASTEAYSQVDDASPALSDVLYPTRKTAGAAITLRSSDEGLSTISASAGPNGERMREYSMTCRRAR